MPSAPTVFLHSCAETKRAYIGCHTRVRACTYNIHTLWLRSIDLPHLNARTHIECGKKGCVVRCGCVCAFCKHRRQ